MSNFRIEARGPISTTNTVAPFKQMQTFCLPACHQIFPTCVRGFNSYQGNHNQYFGHFFFTNVRFSQMNTLNTALLVEMRTSVILFIISNIFLFMFYWILRSKSACQLTNSTLFHFTLLRFIHRI